ncbi:MAG: aromatic ring-hydroxylating dioxygenase subunit alpha [Alphaproteobacteria bacterium]|nr:aromatic ring-hydroxylating dioxygenase subunit alpha [Alphaproteobacteria bacterium]
MVDAATILSRAAAGLGREIGRANGLPRAAYTDPAFLAHEQDALFARTWMGVVFSEDVGAPGDAEPVVAAGVPVLIVRGTDGRVRAFHNVCRHRATIVLQAPAKGVRQFSCPYHAWTYDLDGRLVATPYFAGTKDSSPTERDPAALGLVPIACGEWNHIVFINLDGRAPPLDDYLAGTRKLFAPLDLDRARLGHRHAWDFAANWKLVFDNWEVYHHVWVHEGVFDRMSDEVDLKTGEPYTRSDAEGAVMSLSLKAGSPRHLRQSGPLATGALPPIPVKPGATVPAAAAVALLPNTTVTITRDAYVPAIYMPRAPDRTHARMAWYFHADALDEARAAGRDRVLDRWLGPTRRLEDRRGIRAQDHRCMELQQAARGSAVADDVVFSPTWEQNVHYFQRWVLAQLAP